MPGPLPLHDIKALRVLEARGIAACDGDPSVLMARAGAAAWRCVLAQWPAARRVVVACGPGNNGGDGYVLARLAHQAGRAVVVVRLREPATPLARAACDEYLAAGGRIEDAIDALPGADLVVDALFGIGLSRAPDAAAASVIEAINAQPAPVLALDVPSGVDAGTGGVPGAAIAADRSLQFIAAHRGLRTGAAIDHCGVLDLAELGLPGAVFHGVEPAALGYRAEDLPAFFHLRQRDSHKGRHGHVLCIGGDHGGGGAVLLAVEAALRCGAGLASVATRGAHVPALLARRPEAMAHGMDRADQLAALVARADVLAVGPGLGQGAWGRALLEVVLGCDRPRVLDADALNLLAQSPRCLHERDVITPHPGEAARLLGIPVAAVQADRFGAARALCVRYRAQVVLKGAGSIVASPAGPPVAVCAGNPGMATGGMGDLLTGCIAALLAQGLAPREAALAGALLHASAGDAAARVDGERGLLPADLLPWLRRLANPVRR